MSSYDKELIKRRFAKHLEQYNKQSTVQMDICKRLAGLINKHTDLGLTTKGRGYEIGAGTGFLTRELLESYPEMEWHINDIVEQTKQFLNNIIVSSSARSVEMIFGDAETIAPLEGLSIIASASAVQWFNSLRGFIEQSASSLDLGGYLAFSTFGEGNFSELTTLFGASAIRYYSDNQIEQWAVEAGFEVIHSESYSESIYFETPQDAVRYIKETGINATSTKQWNKSTFEEFCKNYTELFEQSDGRVPLTFNPMIFILKRCSK